jgi:hypothetical protein
MDPVDLIDGILDTFDLWFPNPVTDPLTLSAITHVVFAALESETGDDRTRWYPAVALRVAVWAGAETGFEDIPRTVLITGNRLHTYGRSFPITRRHTRRGWQATVTLDGHPLYPWTGSEATARAVTRRAADHQLIETVAEINERAYETSHR